MTQTPLQKALTVAQEAHKNQMYGDKPYIYHIGQVVLIGKMYGLPEPALIACALHDILEDTDYKYRDIKAMFGEEVAEIVYAVTDELGRNRKERKEKTYPKISQNPLAIAVKLCDRIANIMECKGTDPDTLKMYANEHGEFRKALDTGSKTLPQLDNLWYLLNTFILEAKYANAPQEANP